MGEQAVDPFGCSKVTGGGGVLSAVLHKCAKQKTGIIMEEEYQQNDGKPKQPVRFEYNISKAASEAQ